MQTIQAPTTLTVDGKEYQVSSFSETVQRLVGIHTEWRNQLNEERLAATKTEAAIRAVDTELSQLVGKELAEKAAPPAPAADSLAVAPAAPAAE